MIHTISLSIPPELLYDEKKLYLYISQHLQIPLDIIRHVQIVKRSLDARNRKVVFQVKLEVYTQDSLYKMFEYKGEYKNATHSPEVIIVGAGPAGLFAALRALECGLKPVIVERGKNVKDRKHDIAQITRNQTINKDSNWCFGEGGAGTYSDGKLYTRSNKRGSVQDILLKLIEHGANPEILIDSHAHIGTDKLSAIIANIRRTIEEYGGTYHFNTCINDIIVKGGIAKGIVDKQGNIYEGIGVILATGHSARDIYELFYKKQWQLESKPFAMGVRVEHPQESINTIQYHSKNYSPLLPPATYSLATQVNRRGVFSFCMCPGGIIVPAATALGELVINGMSNSMRNSPFANAGIVVQINSSDIPEYNKYGVLSLLQFQKDTEKKIFETGNTSLSSPTQRLTDFVEKQAPGQVNKSSYMCGCIPAPLHQILPGNIVLPLQQAFIQFGKTLKGFYTQEANILAVESRTSSPLRIPRNENYEHVQIKRLYPCGEGAGYAGGIVSSAIDGINCINKLAESITQIRT